VRTLIDSTDISVIGQFIDANPGGTDEFGYDFNSLIAISLSGGGGNFATNINTTASADLSVTYFYGSRPEADVLLGPGGLGFVLLGLAAMGIRRKIRAH